MTPEHLKSQCSWGNIYYEKWHTSAPGVPIIALHGWLDNCQSFQPMAPFIKAPIFCIDLPGHGKSDNLSDGNWYHFVDYIIRLREFIQTLSLTEFVLMGHSMGAAIAAIYSSLYPENTTKLILLDGLGPITDIPENSPQVLKKAILNREAKAKKKIRPFRDIDMAIKVRTGAGLISSKAAEVLTKHQITKTDNGYEWTYDPMLAFTSPLRMTKSQLQAFIKEIEIDSLLLVAEQGLLLNSQYMELANEAKSLHQQKVPGSHYFHMDDPENAASRINDFLIKNRS